MLKFFKKGKDKIIKIMLSNWIKGILATFKSKNPTMWIVIAAILTSGQVVIDRLLASGVIPEGAEWVHWIIWVIGLLLGSGELASFQYKDELKSTDVKPERLVHMAAEDKYEKLLERNRKLEEIIRKA